MDKYIEIPDIWKDILPFASFSLYSARYLFSTFHHLPSLPSCVQILHASYRQYWRPKEKRCLSKTSIAVYFHFAVDAIYSACRQGIPLFTESHREALLPGDGIDAVAPKSAFFRQHVKGGRGGSCCHWQGNGEEWEGRIEREESPLLLAGTGKWKKRAREKKGLWVRFPPSPPPPLFVRDEAL